MNKETLINTVSKLLGVSASEKEFAFQIFLEKTAEILGENEALKYPGVGFFYFKEDAPKSEFAESLLYIPLHNGLELYEENFFLSFDVKKRNKNSTDFDPSVFSLSIDKSTLPFEKDSFSNSDISYHLLKKTIEERVEELIDTAVHIENFRISDTLIGHDEKTDSFLFKEEQETFELDAGKSYEEMIFSRMNFDETLSSFTEEELKTEADFEEFNAGNDVIVEEQAENKNITPTETGETDANDHLTDETYILEEPNLDIHKTGLTANAKNKSEADWTWSDELLGADTELIDNKNYEKVEAIHVEESEKPAVTKIVSVEDPFGELEKAFIDGDKPLEEFKEDSKREPDPVDVIIPEETITIKMEQAMDEEKEKTPVETGNPYSEEENNQKRNIFLFGALILFVLLAAYILFFNGFGIIKKKSPATPQAKPDMVQNQAAEKKDSLASDESSLSKLNVGKEGIAKSKSLSEADRKTADKTQKLKESQAGDLLKEIPNESKVGSNIYTDGKKFYVQVSSWKNITKAEQEAKKLKAKGADAFIVKAYIEEFKGTWYRVRVGSFNSREEAEAFSKKTR